MPCFHKFFKHNEHLENHYGLLPSWDVETLIIGTFNPDVNFHPENRAMYFYGRSKYFWQILPAFKEMNSIENENIHDQISFLKNLKIGLTDILTEIRDADISNTEHVRRIKTVKDNELEKFNNLQWNTQNIKKFISEKNIKAVYFTLLGKELILNPLENTFEFQIRDIEEFCKNNSIKTTRLFTPSGQGIGIGKPRKNKLIHKWYSKQLEKDNLFSFISSSFDILNYPYQI